jgi:hypothetical protein
LAIKTMPLAKAPPRKHRFGLAFSASKVHLIDQSDHMRFAISKKSQEPSPIAIGQ